MSNRKIINLIYDAIVDDSATTDLASALADHLQADSNWMLIGVSDHQPPTAKCVHGLDADTIQAYEETYFRFDPWLEVVDKVPRNRACSLERWVSTQRFQNSVVYQELIRGRVDVMHCLGLTIGDGRLCSTFALQRGKSGRSFDEYDENQLKPYIPHLNRLAAATIRKAKFVPHDLETLITYPDPVIIVDQMGSPVHASPEGAYLLDSANVIGRSSGGRLYSIDSRFSLNAAIRNAALYGITTVEQIDPPSGSHIIAIDPCKNLPSHASITVRNRRRHVEKKVVEASSRFNLTSAEKKLLTSLVMGRSIEEHCICHGTAISTARSQLRSIFGKCFVQRQSDLMTLVLETPTR